MRLFPVVCLLILHASQGRDDDDDEPYDPYTTTDPKKREPSPCEGKSGFYFQCFISHNRSRSNILNTNSAYNIYIF